MAGALIVSMRQENRIIAGDYKCRGLKTQFGTSTTPPPPQRVTRNICYHLKRIGLDIL